jgi:hypothetical protein
MDDRKFEVRCNAKPHGELQVKTQSLSVRIAQTISRDGAEEMWDSVLVLCEQGDDGLLTTRVVVCHPDWDQHLQIARIQSRTTAPDQPTPALEFDLKPINI